MSDIYLDNAKLHSTQWIHWSFVFSPFSNFCIGYYIDIIKFSNYFVKVATENFEKFDTIVR